MTDVPGLTDAEAAQAIAAAFADGERVSADDLDRALATPDGRACLIDVLVLRDLVDEHGAGTRTVAIAPLGPPTWGAGPAAPIGRPPSAVDGNRTPVAWRPTWIAAAMLLVASVGSGFAAGWRAADRVAGPVETAGAFESIVLPATNIDAPAPTQVIRFQPGVDWQETAGGN